MDPVVIVRCYREGIGNIGFYRTIWDLLGYYLGGSYDQQTPGRTQSRSADLTSMLIWK